VTDLPKARVSDRHVATIYAARWGIAVFFRTFTHGSLISLGGF
jgi:hypothetical protein